MAKVQALEWKAFMSGEVKTKEEAKATFNWKRAAEIAAVGIVAMSALHSVPVFASAVGVAKGVSLVTVAGVKGTSVVAAAADPSIFSQLHAASEPIRQLIFAAGHEIYFVFMAWGAIEAMIGKPAQGFARMKTATLAYILLVWTPWIVDRVNGVTPLGA